MTKQRWVLVVVGAVVLVNVIVSAVGSLVGGGNPGGPAASSFSTGSDGLEAYADLLAAEGHPVARLDEGASVQPVAPSATIVVADPGELSAAETQALVSHVVGGGRLVLAGESSEAVVRAVTGSAVRWRDGDAADELRIWIPTSETGAAQTLAGDGGGRWSDVGGLLPVAGAGSEPAIVTAAVGEGSVVALADALVLDNAHLDEADNAELGLALAGPADGPVAFLESVHGYADSGLEAVPTPWKWTAAGLVVAAAIGLWAAGTRFGPPERAQRRFPPVRLDHVEAVAADLARVTPPPADLDEALRQGAADAALERRRLGRADPPTPPGVLAPDHPTTDPQPAGDRS